MMSVIVARCPFGPAYRSAARKVEEKSFRLQKLIADGSDMGETP
jgi:hypothetical protein